MKTLVRMASIALIAVAVPSGRLSAQGENPPFAGTGPARNPGYADLADLALASQIALVATVRDAVRLKGADAASLAPGQIRFYVEADVDTLLTGPAEMPARVSWLVDMPLDSANRPPRLKKARLILLARPVAQKPGMIRLVSSRAQLPWSPELEQRLRGILSEAMSPSAPPAVREVGHAFHVAGNIPGESETQIFLTTANSRPVSIDVQRHPGEQPRWTVSLGDIVDDSTSAPRRDTLLWYRLACGLPASLPDSAVSDQAPDDAAAARQDYRFVLDQLGPCGRTTGPSADQAGSSAR